jgi:hypothetical protein
MTAKDRNMIKNFLGKCLADGHYCFTVCGRPHMLELEQDVETILTAIQSAPPEVRSYRAQQARAFIDSFP